MNLSRLCRPLICCLYLCACAGFFNASGQTPVPRFERSDCAVPVPKGEKVECGYLVVREDRTSKNSQTIRLPIIILQSDNPHPQPDPILRTLGGPGGSSLRMIGGRRFSPWLKDRNVIIFEQRGTRYAQPALECPEVNAANIDSAKQHLDAKTARANELQAAKSCHERLTKQGINLSAYNSAESAADIEDLRRVLNLDKLNLYGVSYSARLMLNVMRDYPQGIRSVVLESTLLPQVNYDEVGVDAIVRSLNVLFRNCKTDARCDGAYPNLEAEFYEAVGRLNKQPISASVKDAKTGATSEIKLNGNDFATWLIDYLLSNDAESIADAPLVIHQTFQGNYDAFKKYANEKVSPSSSSLGMRYSVWCGEELTFESRRKITAQSFRYPRLTGYEVMALPDICRVWKVRPAKAIENRAVKSDVPTLIVSAEYDAYTPPEWGRLAAQTLKNSFLFEVPWAGHGPGFSSPCARQMIAEFFADPKVAPNPDCLRQTREKYKFVVNK
jgi:pimeloyl-ACP methyl ester carboxylesterase